MANVTDNLASPRVYDAIIDQLLERKGRWNESQTELTFCCPAHNDDRPSASFNAEKQVWYCHTCQVKGGWIDLCKWLGIEWQSAPPRLKSLGQEVYAYDYRDETGALFYQSVRYANPKTFRRRRPNGRGGWIWGLNGIKLVLYHLPEILGADPATMVVLVEGEKDADRLQEAGVLATTSIGGAGSWRTHYAETLRDRHIAILPDNDIPGRGYARAALASLLGVAASVRVVELPGLPPEGDVSDFLNSSDVGALLALIEGAPTADGYGPYEANADDAPTNGHVAEPVDRPIIDAGEKDLPVIRALAWEALCQKNTPTPSLFLHGGYVTRLDHDAHGWPVLTECTVDTMVHELAKAAIWQRTVKRKTGFAEEPTYPPPILARDLMVDASPPLPVIVRIVHTPVMACDGSVMTTPGYYEQSRCYYDAPSAVVIDAIPDAPSPADIDDARTIITTELLGDFPFASPSDLANAVAMLLLPFVRDIVHGPTPLHMIESPTPGSGKGLLAQVNILIATGKVPLIATAATDEEEWRKKITSALRNAPAAIVFDNVGKELTSDALSAVLTADMWEDRLLGSSQMIRFPVRCLWAATGNNPVVSTDMARRTIRIRLMPDTDNPWEKPATAFRHPKLVEWATEHRAELVRACLVLARAWFSAGIPDGKVSIGSYERWASVIGGILETAGIPGFLANRKEFYETADSEGAVWRTFVEHWWEKFGDGRVTTAELLPIAIATENFDLGRSDKERGQQTSLGMALKKHRDRVLGSLKIVSVGKHFGIAQWKLLKNDRF